MRTPLAVSLFTILAVGSESLYKIARKKLLRRSGKPFRIFWNTPSANCEKDGAKIDLEKFDIEHNDGQSWNGPRGL